MASPRQPLGPFLGNSGEITPGGALHFLNPTTDVPKTLYADEALTTPAANPIFLDSSGRTPYQLFYGTGDYKVRQYELVDPLMVSPIFPDDYALLQEWVDEAYPSLTSGAATTTVDTIQKLVDEVDPGVNTMVTVLGYYTRNDNIDTRVYWWDASSSFAADGGSVLSSSLIGTGRWILKTNSPVIDVRWFGAVPESGVDANSAISAACNFAVNSENVKPLSVYFPQGNYIVIPGTITTLATIVIDESVTFFTRIAGDFVLDIQLAYDINKGSVIQHATSVGTATLDFTNTTWGLENNVPVNPNWFANMDTCLKLCASNPVLMTQNATLLMTQAHTNKNFIFRDNATLTIDNSASFLLTVLDIRFTGTTTALFDYTYIGSTLLSFDSTIDIYSSWFANAEVLKYAVKTDCGLILNSNITLGVGYTLSLTLLRFIRSDGGAILINDGTTLSTCANLIGLIFSFTGTLDTSSLTITGPRYNSANFFLGDAHNFRQFIRLANTNSTEAHLNGANASVDVNLVGLGDVSIRDFNIGGTLLCENTATYQTVTMNGCKILGATSASFTLFNLNNCTIQSVIDAHEVNIDNSTITQNITSGVMNIDGCTIDSATLIPDDRTSVWNFNITDNEFLGGFIIPNGSALSKKAYITGNDFQFPVGGNPATTLYLPIDDSTFAVTGESVAYIGVGNSAKPIAYNVLSKDNTPWRYNFGTADLTLGTVVAQTSFDFISSRDGATPDSGDLRLGNWVLKPYMASGQQFASIAATCILGDGNEATSPGEAANVSFGKTIDTTTYTLPTIHIQLWSEVVGGNADGCSGSFSLYPQRDY